MNNNLPLALLTMTTLLTSPLNASDNTTLQALATLKTANDKAIRFVLDNGLTCLIKEDRSSPVVAIQIWVGTGSIHEDELLGSGLSHYIEHMIFKGTPTRKPGDIAREIHDLGGNLNAYTSLDRTVFHTTLPSRHWRAGLDIFSDAVLNPVFPESEWQKEKDVILREMSMGLDNPDIVLNHLLWRTAFMTHPYRVPVIGYEDIFKSLSRDNLVDFYRRRYSTDNMVVAVVGAVPAAEVESALRERFASVPRRTGRPPMIPAEPAQIMPRFARETGPYKISRLNIAFHGVSMLDPDAPALELLASIVGNGQSSRLVHDIKEKRRLVHDISAGSFAPSQPGVFIIEASLDPDKEDKVLDALYETIDSWSTTLFSSEEIEKARRMLLVNELSTLQTMHGQASSFAFGELFMKNHRLGELYLENLARVTARDLRTVAGKYLRKENRTTVVLSPAREKTAARAAAPDRDSPPLERRTLPQGIPLIIRETHHLPFVYFSAVFKGGTLAETEPQAGFTRLMSDLLVRGTTRRSADDIARTIETMGAELTPFCGQNSFGLQGRCLAPDADRFMELFFECLASPAFPDDEVDKQRVIQLASIDAQWEKPMFVAQDSLDSMLFAGHPYRWNPLGRRESVEKADAGALRPIYQRLLRSGNMTLAMFGDISADEAERLAARHTARLPKGPAPSINPAPASPILPARSEKREPKEQCIVIIGFPGVALDDPRRPALEIVEASLSGMSSRVFHSIREERGLAYYAGARQRIGVAPGNFILLAGTRPDAAAEVESLLVSEVARVAREGLLPDEIARAKSQLIADHDMQLQDNMSLSLNSALNEIYGLGFNYGFETARRIEAVTADQVRDAAASVFVTNRMAISIVLPINR